MKLIERIGQDGPVVTGELLRYLERRGLSPEAARKRVQRLDPRVRRLRGHGLPSNQQLLYLQEDWKSPRFVAALRRAWEKGNSTHANALAVLGWRGDPCPRHVFTARSGAPLSLRGHVSADRILVQLRDLGIVTVEDVPGLGSCVRPRVLAQEGPKAASEDSLPRVRAIHLAERIVIDALGAWLRKLGVVSYKATKLRDATATPEFAGFNFDLVGPSYARPLATTTDRVLKPGFVVADVWLEFLGIKEIAGFVRKVNIARAQRRTRPFLSFLIAQRFSSDAWKVGKKYGLLFTTPELLFGKDVQKALAELIALLTSAAKRVEASPDRLAGLFGSLARIEGAAANLRGPLFELMVAHVVSRETAGTVDVRHIVTDNEGARAEVDVLVRGPSRVRAIECRGVGPGRTVGREDVEKWRESRVLRIRDWLERDDELRRTSQTFEFWTTGTFVPEAVAYLETEAAAVRRYEIAWRDGDGVVEALRRANAPKLVEVLKEHYLAHPLAESVDPA